MIELSSQVNNLRLMARLVRDYDYKEISRMLREVSDTIMSLWNSLTTSEAALNKSAGNWAKADAGLRRACQFIAGYGSCPYDTFDLYEPWEESCYQKCSADIDRAECWRRYFELRSDA